MNSINNSRMCPFCGSAVENNQQFCHNCGANLEDNKKVNEEKLYAAEYPTTVGQQQPIYPQQTYGGTYSQYPRQTTTYVPPRRTDDSSGTIALIFGILACTGILPCIGSLIAIIVGSSAKNEGSSSGQAGFILGWVSCCLNIGLIILLFLLIPFY